MVTASDHLLGFVPRSFALCVPEDDVAGGPVVVAWGMTLPDGSVVTVDWSNGPSSILVLCRSAERAAWLHGGELVWVTDSTVGPDAPANRS